MELGLHVWPSDATCRAVWDKFPWPSRLGQVWKSWTYFLLKLQKANIARACGGNHMLTSGCGFLDISHGSPGEWQFDDVKSTLSPHQINNKLLSYAFLVPFAGFWWCFVKLSPQKKRVCLKFHPPSNGYQGIQSLMAVISWPTQTVPTICPKGDLLEKKQTARAGGFCDQ